MLHLIQSDLYKLRKAKSFWICIIVAVVLSSVMMFFLDFTYKAMGNVQSQAQADEQMLQENGVNISMGNLPANHDDLSASALLLSQFASNTSILMAVFLSLFVGSEFTHGTMKNLASKNFSRTQIYLSKLIVGIGASFFLTLLSVAASTTVATALWGFGDVSSSMKSTLIKGSLIELLLIAAFASLFIMFSMLVRQNGASLATNICVLEFVSLFIMIGEMLFKKLFRKTVTLSDYLLSMNMNEVATNTLTGKLMTRSILVGIFFLVVSTCIGLYTFNKRDIK